MAGSTAVAERPKSSPTTEFRDQLGRLEGELATALPPHIPVERFMRHVQTAVNSNPALLRADRRSLFEASMKSAQDGLLPDGADGAFVTFRVKVKQKDESGRERETWIDKVQWMPMVKGILKKVRNSGQLRSISAHVVHEKDRFVYVLGDEERIEHEPALGERGAPRLVYAIAHTKDGGVYREVMTVPEIEEVRSVSRAKDSGPWVKWWGEMAKKTVIRRMAKRLPMSTDLDDLIRRDDDLYDFSKRGADGQVERIFKPVQNPLLDVIEHGEPDGDEAPAIGPAVSQASESGSAEEASNSQAEEGAGRQPSAAPAIDKKHPDYLLGWEGGVAGLRKGLTAELKADPVRLAHFEAGQNDGRAQAARDEDA